MRKIVVGVVASFATATLLWAASTAFGDFIAIPRGTSSGDTGRVRWRELAANGQHSVDFKAPDSLAATIAFTLPSALPASNDLKFTCTTAGICSFATDQTGGGGGGGGCGEPVCLAEVPTTGWTSSNFAGTTSLVNDTTNHLDLIRETANSNNLRTRYRTAPSTPFICAADFVYVGGAHNENWFGIGQRESSTAEWAIVIQRANGNLGAYRTTAEASPGFTAIAGDSASPNPGMRGKVVRLATRDDGTNRQMGFIDSEWNFSISHAGVATESRTTGMTADQVGWFIYKNADVALSVSLIGWECR